jgi:hypothetical protein
MPSTNAGSKQTAAISKILFKAFVEIIFKIGDLHNKFSRTCIDWGGKGL